jgi:hypothetical protein
MKEVNLAKVEGKSSTCFLIISSLFFKSSNDDD